VGEGAAWLARARAKGMTFAMIPCAHCGGSNGVNPQLGRAPRASRARLVRCPVNQCMGWVGRLKNDEDPPPVFVQGCGQCGSIWYRRAALETEIAGQVARRKHRKAVYLLVDGRWRARTPEPRDYERRVLREPDDAHRDFVRG
jgi:hypothetical protein